MKMAPKIIATMPAPTTPPNAVDLQTYLVGNPIRHLVSQEPERCAATIYKPGQAGTYVTNVTDPWTGQMCRK